MNNSKRENVYSKIEDEAQQVVKYDYPQVFIQFDKGALNKDPAHLAGLADMLYNVRNKLIGDGFKDTLSIVLLDANGNQIFPRITQ